MNVLLASLEATEAQLQKCHENILEAITKEDEITAEIEYANDHADKIHADNIHADNILSRRN